MMAASPHQHNQNPRTIQSNNTPSKVPALPVLEALERVFRPAAGPRDRALARVIRTLARRCSVPCRSLHDDDLEILLAVSIVLAREPKEAP